MLKNKYQKSPMFQSLPKSHVSEDLFHPEANFLSIQIYEKLDRLSTSKIQQ